MGSQNHVPSYMRTVAKTLIQRDRLGWRWRVMDYDQQVETGTESTWLLAQQAAERARKDYIARFPGRHNEKNS